MQLVESYPGITSSALSFILASPYDFDLYRTYGVPSDAIRVRLGLRYCIDYGIINGVRVKM